MGLATHFWSDSLGTCANLQIHVWKVDIPRHYVSCSAISWGCQFGLCYARAFHTCSTRPRLAWLTWVLALGQYMIYKLYNTHTHIFVVENVAMHFEWWTYVVRKSTHSLSWMLLTLGYGYAFKACAIDAYSCFIECMTYCVCDCPYPCQLVTLVFRYMRHASYIYTFVSLDFPTLSTLMHVVHTRMKHYRCVILHQMRNFVGFLPWKCGTFLPYSHCERLMRIMFYVLWCTWPKMLLDFYHENNAKCINFGPYFYSTNRGRI